MSKVIFLCMFILWNISLKREDKHLVIPALLSSWASQPGKCSTNQYRDLFQRRWPVKELHLKLSSDVHSCTTAHMHLCLNECIYVSHTHHTHKYKECFYNFCYLNLCIWVLASMYVCIPCVCLMPQETRRGCWIPGIGFKELCLEN